MTKFIAIGGGVNGGDFDRVLERKIHSFLPKYNANIVFVPYGSVDEEENYQQFVEIYEQFGCKITHLNPGNQDVLLNADLIYFGRGSTIRLMEMLKETGAIPLIHKAIEKGCILAGFSAGAHILFETAGSYEEDIGFTLVKGLGIIRGSIVSHYNYEERAEAYHKLLLGHQLNGIGLDDHAMLVIDGEETHLYRSNPFSNAYNIEMKDEAISICPFSDRVNDLRLMWKYDDQK